MWMCLPGPTFALFGATQPRYGSLGVTQSTSPDPRHPSESHRFFKSTQTLSPAHLTEVFCIASTCSWLEDHPCTLEQRPHPIDSSTNLENMAKKGGAEGNSKKAAGQARKADAAAKKSAAVDAVKEAGEAEEWNKGAKSNAKK